MVLAKKIVIKSLWELYGAMVTRVPIKSAQKRYAALPAIWWCFPWNLFKIGWQTSEIYFFESVGRRQTTPDAGLLPQVTYSKTYVKRPLSKRPKIGFQDQPSLNAGQKYCRMLQGAFCIPLTLIKILLTITITVIKIFVLSIFEWPFCTGFTVILIPHTMSLWLRWAKKHAKFPRKKW